MIDLDLNICSIVKEAYERCNKIDNSHRERFHVNKKKTYVAPFKTYKKDYTILTNLDLEIIDPVKIGYPYERGGVCHDLIMHLLGFKDVNWREFYSSLNSFPKLESPNEGDILVYTKSLNGQNCINHLGQFKDGKVISKFGGGPIFHHGVHQIPFFDKNEKVVHKVHFLETNYS